MMTSGLVNCQNRRNKNRKNIQNPLRLSRQEIFTGRAQFSKDNKTGLGIIVYLTFILFKNGRKKI